METIIVEICIGLNGVVSDFMLPAHVPVGKLIHEIVRLVEQVFPEITFGGVTPMLFSTANSAAIPEELTLAQAGIRDSNRLILV